MQRIIIIGTSGSGKTTLGRTLGQKLGIVHRDIDSFHWQKGWQPLEKEKFRSVMDEFTNNEKWIIDGNYSSIKDITWKKATHIIWLDYKLNLVLKRFFWRSLKRSLTKEELWNGNYETLTNSIFSKDSLFFWILKTHKKHKIEYGNFENDKERSVDFIRLRSPKETSQFINSI